MISKYFHDTDTVLNHFNCKVLNVIIYGLIKTTLLKMLKNDFQIFPSYEHFLFFF